MLRTLYQKIDRQLSRIPPKTVSGIYFLFILFMIWANFWDQHFCIPVTWATWSLVITSVNFLLFPYLQHLNWYRAPGLFLQGCFLWILVYCFLFASSSTDAPIFILMSFGILFMGIGLIPYMWILFGITIWRRYKHYRERPVLRRSFLSGLAFPPVIALFGILLYTSVHADLRHSDQTKDIVEIRQNYSFLKEYALERLMGTHFIYHTRLCLYDGWRPPLHDPMLNVYLAMGNFRYEEFPDTLDDLPTHLGTRSKAYHKVFPERDMAQNCNCAGWHSVNKEEFIDMAFGR